MGRRAFLGLGTNLGDRILNLQQAVQLIRNIRGVVLYKTSSIYETEPVGYLQQPNFLNAVVEIECEISPLDLLQATRRIEDRLGRKREIRWGPRTIDIDILAVEKLYFNNARLHIPHRQLARRRFVLVPFAEIAADFRVFGCNRTVGQLLQATQDHSIVARYRDATALFKKPNEA